MHFGRFKALFAVNQSVAAAAERIILSTAIQSVARRGERFASTVAGTMDKAEGDVQAAADSAACNPTADPGTAATAADSGEARAEWPWKRAKKVAVMISFAGKNYFGMQRYADRR